MRAPTGVVATAPERRLEFNTRPPVMGSPADVCATPEMAAVEVRASEKSTPSRSCDAGTGTSLRSGALDVPGK